MTAVLATVSQHSYSKVDTANAALWGQKIGTSTRVGPAEYFELSSDDGRPTGGRAASGTVGALAAGEAAGARGHRLRDCSESRCSCAAEDQLPNIVQFFAVQLPVVAEPVIEVPKILGFRGSSATFVSRRRSYPIPRYSGLWSTTSTFQFLVVKGALLVFKVFSQDRIQQFCVEQTVDIPVPRSGGLQGSCPGQGSTASSSHVGAADGAGQGVFRTLPQIKKKCGVGSALGVGTGCGL